MGVRLIGALLAAMIAVALAASAAVATEGEGEHRQMPSIDEVGSGTDISREYFPEPYEEPSLFQWMVLPLLGVGVLASFAVLGVYLLWQPRFARERDTKRRR